MLKIIIIIVLVIVMVETMSNINLCDGGDAVDVPTY